MNDIHAHFSGGGGKKKKRTNKTKQSDKQSKAKGQKDTKIVLTKARVGTSV